MTRILVVDDAPDLRLLMRTVLAANGYEVMEADSAAGGLASVDEGEVPDLIVLDVQMPDVDGWEVLATVRRHPRIGHVPVILCSVKQHARDFQRGWELGADAYVTKPFRIDAFVEEVRRVLSRSPEERAAVLAARRAGAPVGTESG